MSGATFRQATCNDICFILTWSDLKRWRPTTKSMKRALGDSEIKIVSFCRPSLILKRAHVCSFRTPGVVWWRFIMFLIISTTCLLQVIWHVMMAHRYRPNGSVTGFLTASKGEMKKRTFVVSRLLIWNESECCIHSMLQNVFSSFWIPYIWIPSVQGRLVSESQGVIDCMPYTQTDCLEYCSCFYVCIPK